MAASTTSAVLVGATGLVGSTILPLLQSLPSITSHTLSRKAPASHPTHPSSTFTPTVNADQTAWSSALKSLVPSPSILFSALGTTRAAAGGADQQYKIDHDLNLELAKAAKEAGASVYVLISTSSANAKSGMFYLRMKGEIEEGAKALGFKHVVILQPGMLLGARQELRAAERVIQGVANGMKGIFGDRATDFWAQDAEVVGRAAVRAGLKCLSGEKPEGVWEVGQAEIVSLAKDEWKAEEESKHA